MKISKKIVSPKILLTCSLAMTVMPQLAQAQSIDCFQNLNFGSIIACPATADTVRLSPTGGTTSGGCSSAGGSSLRGRCLLEGEFFPVEIMQVTLPAATATIGNGTSNMDITNFDWGTTAGGPTTTVTAFITTVDLGATLNVKAGQPDGVYTGSFTVNVNYQ